VTLYTASGSLPRHLYVRVDGAFVGADGWLDAVWFGLHAHPGRAWGCTVLLECGAVYRNLPPHAIGWGDDPPPWTLKQAQLWDCYGAHFSAHVYAYLDGLDAVANVCGEHVGCEYLFTVIPIGDAFTQEPSQDKELMFLKARGGRLTIQPTNRVRFIEASFTNPDATRPALEVTRKTYRCEESAP
jgi:hypothetical protein